jgi:hypothetical protein
MDGVRRERQTVNQLRRSWWQMERGAEAKSSENGRFFNLNFIHVVQVVSIPTSYVDTVCYPGRLIVSGSIRSIKMYGWG